MGNDCSEPLFELRGVPEAASSRSTSVLAADTQVAFVAIARDVRALTRPPAPDICWPSRFGSTGARLVRVIGENLLNSLAATRPMGCRAGVSSGVLTSGDNLPQPHVRKPVPRRAWASPLP